MASHGYRFSNNFKEELVYLIETKLEKFVLSSKNLEEFNQILYKVKQNVLSIEGVPRHHTNSLKNVLGKHIKRIH